MWIDKRVYAPEGETGADQGAGGGDAGGTPQVPMNERPVDGPGSGRSDLRKQLEGNFEKSRKEQGDQDQQRERRDPDRNRDRRSGQFTSRARAEGMTGDQQEGERAGEQQGDQQGEQQGEQQSDQIAAPEGWSREAKAEWANLAPAVQAAVAKRETDMAKGVEDLKAKYADLDKALAPRMELIKRHNQTAAAAVNQLFAWFEALTANPLVAFPALAESFKFDLRSIPGLIPQPGQGQQGQQEQKGQKEQDDEPVYVKELRNQVGTLQQQFRDQFGQLTQSWQQDKWNQTRTILENWAKDKPYFNEVRQTMGQLITAGTVPPLPNGDADLDRAYDMALWAQPEIRAKVLADQQKKADDERKAKEEKERKAQQEQVDKARRANGGSLTQGAPGNPAQPDQKNKKSKSVRESIEEARKELAER